MSMFSAYNDSYGGKQKRQSKLIQVNKSETLMAHRPGSTSNIQDHSKYFDFIIPKQQVEKNRIEKLGMIQSNLREL